MQDQRCEIDSDTEEEIQQQSDRLLNSDHFSLCTGSPISSWKGQWSEQPRLFGPLVWSTISLVKWESEWLLEN